MTTTDVHGAAPCAAHPDGSTLRALWSEVYDLDDVLHRVYGAVCATATLADIKYDEARTEPRRVGLDHTAWRALDGIKDIRERYDRVFDLARAVAFPGGAAAPAGAARREPVDLPALERELLELRRRHETLPVTDDSEAEAQQLFDACWALERRIAEMPATTLADVATKIRRLRALDLEFNSGEEFTYKVGRPLYDTALEALERMAAAGPGRGAPPAG